MTNSRKKKMFQTTKQFFNHLPMSEHHLPQPSTPSLAGAARPAPIGDLHLPPEAAELITRTGKSHMTMENEQVFLVIYRSYTY